MTLELPDSTARPSLCAAPGSDSEAWKMGYISNYDQTCPAMDSLSQGEWRAGRAKRFQDDNPNYPGAFWNHPNARAEWCRANGF